MNTAEIIDPTRRVRLRDGSEILVRELAWMDALQLLQLLAKQSQAVMGLLSQDAELTAAAVAQDKTLVAERLVKHLAPVVAGCTDVAAFLIQHAVAEEHRARIDRLPISDALTVLRHALELTINEDMVREGNAIAAVLRKALVPAANGTPTSTGSGPNPSSSGKDILRPWSGPTPSASSPSTAGSAATA